MKYPHTRLIASLAIGALAGFSSLFAQTSGKPIVISPPAVNNGSNWSRAPFPAQRQFDDTKGPDGKAIDETGPNSTVANIEPPPPPARVAILQSAPAPFGAEPGLLPTGRTTVVVAAPLDATTFAPSIRTMSFASRDQMLTDIEARVKSSEKAIASLHNTTSQMGTAGRQQFTTAADDVKAKAKALRKSIKDARKATDAQWDAARAQVASDYEAYAAAVAQIDAATGATIH